MKKSLLSIAAMLIITVMLCSCGEKVSGWARGEDLGNGVVAVLSDIESKNGESWYCTADGSTGEILSVNIIYPESFPAPGETVCTVNKSSLEVSISSGERESGGVLFITLPHDVSVSDCNDKIKIVQHFGNMKCTLVFRPSDVFAALDPAASASDSHR